MKKSTIIILGIVTLLILGGVSIFTTWVSYRNQEVKLRHLVETKQRNIENVYDKMWKTLSQKAGVATEYKTGFSDVFVKIMDSRYSKGDGSLMKFIKESNPHFDVSLYSDLSNSIESLRTEFANEQKDLLDIVMQYNNLIDIFPGSIFLLGKEHIEAKLITSGRSKEALASGEDNDVELFEKEKIKQDSIENKK